MTIEEMQKRKEALKLSYQDICDRSGVPTATVQKIITGTTMNPREYNVSRIERVLEQNSYMLGESLPVLDYSVSKQGNYTVLDYYSLPPEERFEILDGTLYSMAAPTILHQDICGSLYVQLKNYVKINNGSCKPRISPMDVKLDDRTILQPDVLVLCDSKKNKGKLIDGAPDFVAEVVSDSTRGRDYFTKLNKYYESGVKEYWIIDPLREVVNCYDFKSENYESVRYTFDEDIPVMIWDGRCKINIKEYL